MRRSARAEPSSTRAELRSARAGLRDRRGTGALEFALVGGLGVMLLLGIMEAARFQFTLQALRSLAGEAARTASLRGAANMNAAQPPCTGLSGPLTGLDLRAPFLSTASLTVAMSGCTTQGAVTRVTVTVRQDFAFTTSLIRPASLQLTETASAVFN